MNGLIEGTLKRGHQSPFTYDQVLHNSKDKRLLVKTEGTSQTYCRQTAIKDETREIGRMTAFRDNRGQCTLMGSSDPIHYSQDVYDSQTRKGYENDTNITHAYLRTHSYCTQTDADDTMFTSLNLIAVNHWHN